jgi:hypothetical protein
VTQVNQGRFCREDITVGLRSEGGDDPPLFMDFLMSTTAAGETV